MQSQPTYTRRGVLTDSRTYDAGSPNASTVTVTNDNYSLSGLFSCVNGNVKGDRKKPNPFSFSKTNIWWMRGSLTERHFFGNGSGSNYTRVYDGVLQPSVIGTATGAPLRKDPPPATQVIAKAMDKIYDQLRGNSQVLVDALEGGQTLKMLKGTAKLHSFMADFFNALMTPKEFERVSRARKEGRPLKMSERRLGKSGPARIPHKPSDDQFSNWLDYATSKWLEVRYGWTPLVHSIYDAFDNIMKKSVSQPLNIKSRASKHEDVSDSVLVGQGYKLNMRGETSTRVELNFFFSPPTNKLFDWTTLNPASLAWQLLPLSFVADWLTNIGQCLEQQSDWVKFNPLFVSGYQTVSTLVDCSTTAASTLKNVGTMQTGVLVASGRIYESTLNRSILGSLPAPTSPRFEVKLGGKQMLDAAGLFHQLLGKKLRLVK